MKEVLQHIKVRWVKNRHGSAEKAYEAWRFKTSESGLWGNPIKLEGKIHVYGVNLKSKDAIDVEFTNSYILIMKRIQKKEG